MDQEETTGPVNVGNPVERSMLELAQAVLEATGSSSELKYVELPEDDPMQRCPDISRARKILDWEPRVDLKVGLKATIDYYRQLLAREK